MKKTLAILAAATMLFVACDKIEPTEDGTYTLFAGISATWSDGDAVTPVQRALVEKFTGPRCVNCPMADVTLDAASTLLGEQLVVVTINHPTGQGLPFPGNPDMRTDDGNTWDAYYGINELPAAYINRDKSKQYTGSMDNITGDLQSVIGQSPLLGLVVTADSTADGSGIDITVNMQFEQTVDGKMTLTLALIEDSLEYRQLNGSEAIDDYAHNHMLRDVMTDVWGSEVDATGIAGERRKATFSTYRIKDNSIRLENCHVVAFVSDKNSKRVLNSASCHIE